MAYSLLLLSVIFTIAFGQDELTVDSFDTVVDGSKSVFAMFYAPWCGHCKTFKPEYAKVAASFAKEDSVAIVSVDADKHRDLAGRFGVTGFPTLKFFSKGSTEPEDYTSGRTAQDLVSFINDKAGTSAAVTEPPSPVKTLTTKNFDSIAFDKTKDVLVEFYAPWCGHCKKLAPVFDVVATAFLNEPDVVVAKVDATTETELGSKYAVQGYPTLKFFPRNSDEVVDYNSARTAEAFVEFLNENAGTRRKVDGSLSRSAGRVPELDVLAHQYLTHQDERQKTLEALQTVCEYKQEQCKYYLKYARKISDKGDEFAATERDRLGKLQKSDSITKDKRDSFVLRMNILNGFLEGEESLVEETKEKDAKEEL